MEDRSEKKPYTPPKLTEHGSAVEQTKGLGGDVWELRSAQVEDHLRA